MQEAEDLRPSKGESDETAEPQQVEADDPPAEKLTQEVTAEEPIPESGFDSEDPDDQDLSRGIPQMNLYSLWGVPDLDEPYSDDDMNGEGAQNTLDEEAEQDISPGTPQEEQRIANLSAKPEFDEPVKDFLTDGSLPRPRDEGGSNEAQRMGQRWKTGACFTISQTIVYAIDMDQGRVHDICCAWDELQSGHCSEADAFKLYIHQAGIADSDAAIDEDGQDEST